LAGRYRPRPKLHCVRWIPSSHLPKKGHSPEFSAHVFCGQTAGLIKMTLGMKVGLGPGHTVLDGDPAPPQKRAQPPPNFRLMSIVTNGWMDQDATWYECRPQPKPHCVRRRPSSPSRRGHSSPPLFCPCLLWPRSPVSATAELLLWPPCVVDAALYFCPTVSLFYLLFPRLISAAADWMATILRHMAWP